MGGIPTRELNCLEFEVADAVDIDIDNYIMYGLMVEADEMIYFSWYWWAMYIWNLNTQAYINLIQDILDCGMTNNVEGSKYANEDWINNVWLPNKEIY